jgi:hypothetical protein
MWVRDGDMMRGTIRVEELGGVVVIVVVPMWVAAALSCGAPIGGDALLDAVRCCSVQVAPGSIIDGQLEVRSRC